MHHTYRGLMMNCKVLEVYLDKVREEDAQVNAPWSYI